MSKLLPRVSELSRVDGIEHMTDIKTWAPRQKDLIVYSAIDSEGDHSNRHPTQENQLVTHERQSRSPRMPATTASGKGDPSTKSIATNSRSHFANTHRNVSNFSVNRRRSYPADDRSGREKTMPQPQFDAIWDPAQNRDMTVHLKMNVHQDIAVILEEFCYLQRLGNFNSAKSYFEENLRDHIDDPYVLVQYGEMLLEQGDYLGLSKLSPLDQYHLDTQGPDPNGMRFLNEYWELVLLFAGCHHINRRPKEFTLNRETLRLLHGNVIQDERNITSTEIKYLALLYQLCGLHSPEVANKGLAETINRSFPRSFHKKLYQSLLREGRIWDLRDIIVARMAIGSPWKISAVWSTNANFRVRLNDLVTEWTTLIVDYDRSTHLALLEILISLVCWEEYSDITSDILTVATQIARLIIDNDPEAMKARPFIQWILAECANAELGSLYQLQRQEYHLGFLPGVLYRRARRNLAQYVPYKTGNPGWVCEDGPSELQSSARLALRTSGSVDDYRTQVKALQLLIFMLAKPVQEFERLGKLQKLSQGDNYNLAETLAAKYLVSNNESSKQKLRNELADLWCVPEFSSSFNAHQLWVLSMIRHALACDNVEAERALREADAWCENSRSNFFEYVSKKMPTRGNIRQQNGETRSARLDRTRRRSNRRDTSFSPSPELCRRSKVVVIGRRGIEEWREARDREWERSGRSKTLIRIRDPPDDVNIRITKSIWSDTGSATEGSLDESESFRGRSLDRDEEHTHALISRQQPLIVEKSAPGAQTWGPMLPKQAGVTDQNAQNESGHTNATSIHQSAHDSALASSAESAGPIDEDHGKHDQKTIQTNSEQASPDNDDSLSLEGHFEFEGVEDIDIPHEETVNKSKEAASSPAGSLVDFDVFKTPS